MRETRWKQLVENKERKTGKKLTRRIITDYQQGLSSANSANHGLIIFMDFRGRIFGELLFDEFSAQYFRPVVFG